LGEPVNSVDANLVWENPVLIDSVGDFCAGAENRSNSKSSFHPSYAAYSVKIICRIGPTEFSTPAQKFRPRLVHQVFAERVCINLVYLRP